MAALAAIGPLLGAIGTGVSVVGTLAAGAAANDAAQSEAAQLEAKGKEDFAASQREAQDKRREGRLVNSRQQAIAAASGAGADTPTIVKLMTDVAGQSEYNAQTTMFGGLQRKKGMNDSANARRAEGSAALTGSVFDALGTGLSGASKFGTSKSWW